ncbi:MAG TPA: hypothetical protein VJI66_02360 [Candidatus Paceibacterota bacterium]
MEEKIYRTKAKKLKGDEGRSIYSQAFSLYKNIASKTKRRPFIRSKYFNKEKIFLDYFWHHLREKNSIDQKRRLVYYACAIDLIKSNRFIPTSKNDPNNKSDILHRFSGITKNNDLFYVQIKENLKTKEKYFISVFPD